MNPATIKIIATTYSMRKEVKIIFLTIFSICLIPVIAVIMLTQVGLNLVSGVLASQNPQTLEVDIYDPNTGAIKDHLTEPAIWPTLGPISLEFSESSPYQLFHTGIDIASPDGKAGTPVASFMKGKVIYADTEFWGFGRHVIIDHGHYVTSIYAHLDTLRVSKGQEVEIGTILGTRGNTGWSTGPHLHFQINVFNLPVNPRTFLSGNPEEE